MSMLRLKPWWTPLLIALLAGCGTPSQPLPMALGPADALQILSWVPEALRAQVAVAAVQGGQETGRWWGSKVSAAALQQALAESLISVGLSPLGPQPPPRFELVAELLQLDQPRVPAAGVTVTVAVRYTLTELPTGRVLYRRQLSTASEAALTEALLSPSERLRLANERALRANISMLLRELVTLRP